MNQPTGPSADFPETEPQPLEPPALPDVPLDAGAEDDTQEAGGQADGR